MASRAREGPKNDIRGAGAVPRRRRAPRRGGGGRDARPGAGRRRAAATRLMSERRRGSLYVLATRRPWAEVSHNFVQRRRRPARPACPKKGSRRAPARQTRRGASRRCHGKSGTAHAAHHTGYTGASPAPAATALQGCCLQPSKLPSSTPCRTTSPSSVHNRHTAERGRSRRPNGRAGEITYKMKLRRKNETQKSPPLAPCK